MYLSIDYSLVSPATCLQGEDHCFHKSEFHYLTDKKSLVGKLLPNIKGWEHKEWKCDAHRYENIAKWVFECVGPDRMSEIEKITIEGYSMGSKGKVFHIAECAGLLKYFIYKTKIPLEIVPPTVVKKDFTGKGNSPKEQMMEEFVRRTGVDLHKIYGPSRKLGSPESDIVDAFAVGLSGRNITKNTLLTS